MKKLLICLSFSVFATTNAFADVGGEYVNKNAEVDVTQKGKEVKFSINSAVGMQACELKGAAEMINANNATYKSTDNSDKCVVILTFAGNQLKVKTKDCDGYCGMDAAGSMDGTYRKKLPERK